MGIPETTNAVTIRLVDGTTLVGTVTRSPSYLGAVTVTTDTDTWRVAESAIIAHTA